MGGGGAIVRGGGLGRFGAFDGLPSSSSSGSSSPEISSSGWIALPTFCAAWSASASSMALVARAPAPIPALDLRPAVSNVTLPKRRSFMPCSCFCASGFLGSISRRILTAPMALISCPSSEKNFAACW